MFYRTIVALIAALTVSGAHAQTNGIPAVITNLQDIANAIAAGLGPKGTPVTFSLNFIINPNGGPGPGFPYNVPLNQRLVIENIDGNCSFNNDVRMGSLQLAGTIQNNPGIFHVINVQPLITANGQGFFEQAPFSYLTKIYVDPGAALNLAPSFFNINISGSFSCFALFSGQLFNIQ